MPGRCELSQLTRRRIRATLATSLRFNEINKRPLEPFLERHTGTQMNGMAYRRSSGSSSGATYFPAFAFALQVIHIAQSNCKERRRLIQRWEEEEE